MLISKKYLIKIKLIKIKTKLTSSLTIFITRYLKIEQLRENNIKQRSIYVNNKLKIFINKIANFLLLQGSDRE